jgi:hypothetical protein
MENSLFQREARLRRMLLQLLRIENENDVYPPEVQQITLLNREEISQWLF